MRFFNFVGGLLSYAIIAAQAQYLNWDLASNALGPNLFDDGKSLDIFQPSDASDINFNVGSLGDDVSDGSLYDESDPLLFSTLPNDACYSSPLNGKAWRRSDHAACGEGTPDLSIPSIGTLEKPGGYEQSNCKGGGYLSMLAFLVCSSSQNSDSKPASLSWTLFQSTRGRQVQFFHAPPGGVQTWLVNAIHCFMRPFVFVLVANELGLVYTPQDAAKCIFPRGLFCCDLWIAGSTSYFGGSMPELSFLVSCLYSITITMRPLSFLLKKKKHH